MTVDASVNDATETFLQVAVNGDARAGVRVALELLDHGVPSDVVIIELLASAQRQAGERWLRREWTVADEHLVSGCTQRALDAVANTADPPVPSGLLVVACAEGDWHSLPAQMFAELLRSRGFTVLFLGASTPADHVAALLARRPADAVIVSCNLPLFFGGVTRLADAAHRHGVPVIAGGRSLGHGPDRAAQLGADAWASSVEQADAILRGWQSQAPPISAQPTVLSAPAVELDLNATVIADAAFESLTAAYPAMADYRADQLARTREDLAYLTRFIAAARLVNDPTVFTDFLGWLGAVLSNRGIPPAAMLAGLEALAPLISTTDPTAARLALDALQSAAS